MPHTSNDAVLTTFGPTDLPVDAVEQAIEDANFHYNLFWADEIQDKFSADDNPPLSDIEERIERLLACHIMKDTEPEIINDSETDLSAAYNVPKGDIEAWLENSTQGRTLKNILLQLDVTVEPDNRALSRVYQ